MRVFLAGATGAVGRRMLPLLIDAGFEVTGTSRSSGKIAAIEAAGAHGVVMNALDAGSVNAAIGEARPDVVIHQLTALAAMTGDLKHFDDEFAETNRLRTQGTDHLLAAARSAEVTRFIAQSYTGWPNERGGTMVKSETNPIDPSPTAASVQTVAGIRHLESTVTGATDVDGLALRFGALYGPGTGLGIGGDLLELVRGRKLPVVGGGAGVWSFLHIDDAAAATVAAITRSGAGVYNIVDDEPAPVSDWLPFLADAIGAKPPLRLPAWLARPLIGEHGISLMTQIRGSSNAKARAELEWQPLYPSWREGFRTGLG